MKPYQRYQIETKKTPHIIAHPHRFSVKVNRLALAKLLLKELLYYRGNMEVVLSRPCVYGVFSGPVGGFAPIEEKCVGCLRCTTQYPETVQIFHNPQRNALGDSYFTPEYVDTVVHEAESGRVPIKGAGYRGKFGGQGWDGMWTDMSEIVRPTRDGIHGREYISTAVDIGTKPPFLDIGKGQIPHTFTLPIPLLFDIPPTSLLSHRLLCEILAETARELQTLAILPLEAIKAFALKGSHIVPSITPEQVNDLNVEPQVIELSHWNAKAFQSLKSRYPQAHLFLRTDYDDNALLDYYRAGVRVFHLTADYHGRQNGEFALDLIRKAHLTFVQANCRDEVTLIGSGGIIAAEHLPKAILCGLDAAALDTPALVALQARFVGDCSNRTESRFQLPKNLIMAWGIQRLKNLAGSWHDQLLEIMGAMGLREVRRLRGEMGRALLQKEFEDEAFTGIAGYEPR